MRAFSWFGITRRERGVRAFGRQTPPTAHRHLGASWKAPPDLSGS